jgi:hypothetical protein
VRKAITSLVCVLLAGCTAQADTCDRQCLIDLTNDYVSALATGGAAGLPLSDDLITVEDLKRIGANGGLWQSATGGPGAFAIHVPDPIRQTAGWMGMMERSGEPVLVAIRLQLEGGKIVEAEHLTTANRPENLPRLQTVRPGFLAEIPEAQRLDPGRLIDIAETYYDALDENDGSRTPFAADCERHENGMIAAGGDAGPGPSGAGLPPIARDCAGQLSSNVMAYIDAIENRRVFAADPVTGLVMGLSHFRHSMDFEPYEVTALDGSKITYGPDRFPFEPFDLPAAHVFKIGPDGRMHEIEAMGFLAPYQSRTGWE